MFSIVNLTAAAYRINILELNRSAFTLIFSLTRSTLKTQPSARDEINISDGWI